MKNSYELMLILSASLSADEEKENVEKVEKLLSGKGAVLKNEKWGKREFSFPIKKEKEGIYYLFSFDYPSLLLTEVSQKLSMNTKILRFLIQTISRDVK